MRLLKTFETQKGMTRRFFSEKLEFQCRACMAVCDSRYRIETVEGVICNGCYSAKLEGREITVFKDKESRPWSAERVRKKKLA